MKIIKNFDEKMKEMQNLLHALSEALTYSRQMYDKQEKEIHNLKVKIKNNDEYCERLGNEIDSLTDRINDIEDKTLLIEKENESVAS